MIALGMKIVGLPNLSKLFIKPPRQTHRGGLGARNLKNWRVDQNRLESRSMEISPWGLVVFSCLACDVREVS